MAQKGGGMYEYMQIKLFILSNLQIASESDEIKFKGNPCVLSQLTVYSKAIKNGPLAPRQLEPSPIA